MYALLLPDDCALPSLLISLGLGSTLTFLMSQTPWIIQSSSYITEIFLVTGSIIALSTLGLLFQRQRDCDLEHRDRCRRAQRFNLLLILLATTVYAYGAYYTFGAGSCAA